MHEHQPSDNQTYQPEGKPARATTADQIARQICESLKARGVEEPVDTIRSQITQLYNQAKIKDLDTIGMLVERAIINQHPEAKHHVDSGLSNPPPPPPETTSTSWYQNLIDKSFQLLRLRSGR